MARRLKNRIFTLANDGDNADFVGMEGKDSFCIISDTGSVRVFGSLDGTNFLAKQLILCQEPPNSGDTVSSQAPVYVAKTTAGIPAWIEGDYKSLRIQQAGATAAAGLVSAAGENN